MSDHLFRGNEIEEIPDIAPLIAGVLDLDSTALLYGSSGVGKSLGSLDMALCVSTGHDWHGHEVVAGNVLYVIGEGLSGTRQRFIAWKQTHAVVNFNGSVPWFSKFAPNILHPPGRDQLYAWVAETHPVLTVLDTVARCIPGADENSFEAMSQVVETLDHIRAMTGGCALGVHHAGKDAGQGARGHSSLKGAMDTEINVTSAPNDVGPTFIASKQKNHDDAHIIESFEIVKVGDSVVLETSTAAARSKNDELMVRALGSLGHATWREWLDAAMALGVKQGSFDRCRRRLIGAMVVSDGSDGDGPPGNHHLI